MTAPAFLRRHAWLLLTITVVTFLSFFKLGQHPVHPWDEARSGVNAFEMWRTGDYVNLRYAGQPDTWSAKPPLALWLTAASFSLFGRNEFALRLPSALAIILAFFFIFRIVSGYRSPFFAACTCGMLASVSGLIGWHVGRTGDMDALLVCLLMAATYFFLQWLDFQKPNAVRWAGLCLGLAFLAKGPAAAGLLPGLALYVWLSGRLRQVIISKKMWSALLLFLLFPAGWFLVTERFGSRATGTAHSEGTAFVRSFSYDLWRRFTQTDERWKPPFDPGFMVTSLDKNFNLWHLVFFGMLAYGIFLWCKNRQATWAALTKNPRHRLLLLSLCTWLPLAFFLAMAAKSNRWYLAPALPFVGIATFYGIRHFWVPFQKPTFLSGGYRHSLVQWCFWALLTFTLGRRVLEFSQPSPKPPFIGTFENRLRAAPCLVQRGWIEQDVLLYLYFYHPDLRFEETAGDPDCLLVSNRTTFAVPTPNRQMVGKVGDYELYEP